MNTNPFTKTTLKEVHQNFSELLIHISSGEPIPPELVPLSRMALRGLGNVIEDMENPPLFDLNQ